MIMSQLIKASCRLYSTTGLNKKLPEALSLHNLESIQEITNVFQSTLDGATFSTSIKSDSIECTPEVLTDYVSSYYKSILTDDTKKQLFFSYLVQYLGPNRENISIAANRTLDVYKQERDLFTFVKAETHLQNVLSPLYMKLLGLLVHKEGGLKMLIDMRSDLLSIIKKLQDEGNSSIGLQELDTHFQSLLSQWFSLSFLDLQQITWQSPCDIVEKVSEYEAVHSVRHWKDIKHRVGPFRRVFVFTHRSIPRDPIIILHSALTHSPSSNIQTLLKRQPNETESFIRTAVFYSISAAHKGLSGIDLGNSLILQVVRALQNEFSTLEQFVTLSPIPGFRIWLNSHLRQCIQNPDEVCKVSAEELTDLKLLYPNQTSYLSLLQNVLSTNEWATKNTLTSTALKLPVLSLCAKYLIQEKRRGLAMNRVTNFHIRNGASLWRLNWLADTSPKGLQQSYGIMANYQYDLSCMSDYNQRYVLHGAIHHSPEISKLLGDCSKH